MKLARNFIVMTKTWTQTKEWSEIFPSNLNVFLTTYKETRYTYLCLLACVHVTAAAQKRDKNKPDCTVQ